MKPYKLLTSLTLLLNYCCLCLLTLAAFPGFNSELHAKTHDDLSSLKQQIERNAPSELKEVKLITIKGNELPWTDTKMSVTKDQSVTFLLGGALDFGADIIIQPGTAFWVGFGIKKPMYVPGLNTATVDAPKAGPLYFARSLTEWQNKEGKLATPLDQYKAVKGGIQALTLIWHKNSSPQKGLNELIDKGINHPLVLSEAQRLKSPPKLPKGWHLMWLFGNNGVFKDNFKNDRRQIDIFTHKDVGILQKNVDIALEPGVSISWEWIVKHLPSPKAENTVPTHDYLSIAVEFDDGQDLTYMWSSHLPVGKFFRCPIPRWASIETHYVIRNDKSQLGQWLNEKRNVYDDYKKTIGGKAKRITRIWFIANTVFQRKYGVGSFRNIILQNSGEKLTVL